MQKKADAEKVREKVFTSFKNVHMRGMHEEEENAQRIVEVDAACHEVRIYYDCTTIPLRAAHCGCDSLGISPTLPRTPTFLLFNNHRKETQILIVRVWVHFLGYKTTSTHRHRTRQAARYVNMPVNKQVCRPEWIVLY